jgi:hypothetical protein
MSQAAHVDCPNCGARLEPADFSLKTGWAKCTSCDELFPLGGLVPGSEFGPLAYPLLERPSNARATIETTPSEMIVRVPPTPRARTWKSSSWRHAIGFLAFSTFLSSCIVAVEMVKSEQSSLDALPLTVPFWLIGISMYALVSWDMRRIRTLRINAAEVIFDVRWLFYHCVRRLSRSDVQCARRQDRPTPRAFSDRISAQGVELVYRGGTLRLPAENAAEADWMIEALNDFLDRNRTASAARNDARG